MPKVTFIYAHEPNEVWSTPLSLVNEFIDRKWETEIISIGSNRTGQYHDRNLREWVESNPTTDMVIFLDWGRFDSSYLDKYKLPTAFWVQESGDDPQNWERNSPKCNRFHLTVTPDYPSYQKYKSVYNNNVLWFTHWADSRIHKPLSDVKIQFVATTTRGMGSSQLLDTLTQHSEGSIGNKNGMDGLEHTRFLQSGLMVLQNSRWGEITRRIFEGMACGKMVLTDRLDESRKLEELFTDGVDIVFYDDIVDCIEKINYYANNERERELIAQRGYENVMKNHTQKQRVDVLIKQWSDWK